MTEQTTCDLCGYKDAKHQEFSATRTEFVGSTSPDSNSGSITTKSRTIIYQADLCDLCWGFIKQRFNGLLALFGLNPESHR